MQIKRNYLYKVRIALEDPAGDTYGKVTHAINVKDWTSGVTLAWAGDENLYNNLAAANFTVTGTERKLRDATVSDPEQHLVLPYNAEKSATFYVTSTSTKSGLSLTCPATAVAATAEEGGGYQCTITPQASTYSENGEFTQKWQVTVRESALPSGSVLTFTLQNALNSALSASFEVIGIDLKKNPLWWVAQFNLKNLTTFDESHTPASYWAYGLTESGSASTVSGYHIPKYTEAASIIPTTNYTSAGTNVASITNSASDPFEFNELASDVGGNNVAASKSVFFKNAANDYYAIRFIGTEYASAWHYKFMSSPCNGLLIESYMLTDVSTQALAKAKLTSLAGSSVWETYPSTKANQTPDNLIGNEYGYVQRFWPITGYKSSGSGTTDSSKDRFTSFWYDNSEGTHGYYSHIYYNGEIQYQWYERSHGMPVRLFRNH